MQNVKIMLKLILPVIKCQDPIETDSYCNAKCQDPVETDSS